MTALLHLSMLEALSLWSELEQALHGTNGFGGNTCELYAYRFLAPPLAPSNKEEVDTLRARMLYDLLSLFIKTHQCEVAVDGRSFGGWVVNQPFEHRVHVTVYPAPEDSAVRRTRAHKMIALATALDEAADRIEKVFLDPEDSDVVRFRALAAEVLP